MIPRSGGSRGTSSSAAASALSRARVRFLEKVDQSAPGGCWVWLGSRGGRRWDQGGGYGAFWLTGRIQKAHRVAYMMFRGEIPAGMELDHLCRNTGCVNPEHLEPVSSDENRRRTRALICSKGHDISTPDKRVGRSSGWCKRCHRDRARAIKAGLRRPSPLSGVE